MGTLLVLLQLAFVPSPLAGCLLDPCLEVRELQVSTKSFSSSAATFSPLLGRFVPQAS